MRWSGVILLLFIVYHLLHFTFGNAHPDFVHGDVYHNFVAGFRSRAGLGLLHRGHARPRACTCTTASGACCRRSGLSHPRYNRLRHAFAAADHGGRGRRATSRSRWPSWRASLRDEPSAPATAHASSRCERSPSGPDREEVGAAPLRDEAGQPGQQAQVQRHRRRLRPGRRVGRGHPGRARLQRQVLLLPGQPAPRPLASPPRAASTPPRTTRTTATASTASSTTRSRAATSAPARPTSTGWPSSA